MAPGTLPGDSFSDGLGGTGVTVVPERESGWESFREESRGKQRMALSSAIQQKDKPSLESWLCEAGPVT